MSSPSKPNVVPTEEHNKSCPPRLHPTSSSCLPGVGPTFRARTLGERSIGLRHFPRSAFGYELSQTPIADVRAALERDGIVVLRNLIPKHDVLEARKKVLDGLELEDMVVLPGLRAGESGEEETEQRHPSLLTRVDIQNEVEVREVLEAERIVEFMSSPEMRDWFLPRNGCTTISGSEEERPQRRPAFHHPLAASGEALGEQESPSGDHSDQSTAVPLDGNKLDSPPETEEALAHQNLLLETTTYKWLRLVPPGQFTGLHRDRFYLGSDERVLTCWIPFVHVGLNVDVAEGPLQAGSPKSTNPKPSPSDEEDQPPLTSNGALVWLPGSHRGTRPHVATAVVPGAPASGEGAVPAGKSPEVPSPQEPTGGVGSCGDGTTAGWLVDDAADFDVPSAGAEGGWMSTPFEPGDMAVFGMDLLHMTLPNHTDGYRISCDTRWRMVVQENHCDEEDHGGGNADEGRSGRGEEGERDDVPVHGSDSKRRRISSGPVLLERGGFNTGADVDMRRPKNNFKWWRVVGEAHSGPEVVGDMDF